MPLKTINLASGMVKLVRKGYKMEFLIGINKKRNEIILGEVEITTRNGYKEFTACFNAGEAFDVDNVKLDDECEYRWECYDAQTKLDLLNDGDKTKDEVFEEWQDEMDYRGFIDCSCTDWETTLKSGQVINFASTCGGQYDIREDGYEDITFTNKQAVEKILEYWDKYHCKEIDDETEKEIRETFEEIEKYADVDYIEYFIKENIEVV